MFSTSSRCSTRRPKAPAPGSPPNGAEPADERQKSIQTMVDAAAQRLAAQGGSAREWARLIRSYKVLNEPDKARDALDQARKALSGDAAALGELDALAKELGLNGK